MDQALEVFVDAIAKGDKRTKHMLFDVTTVALPDTPSDRAKLIATRLRHLGVERILYGSDAASGGNLPPREGGQHFVSFHLRRQNS